MWKPHLPSSLKNRRWLVSGLVSTLALLVFGGAVLAGGWCRADPIIELEGEEVQIWAAIPNEYQALVNGPIDVTVTLPTNRSHSVVFTDSGFNGYGETVTFVNGGKATGNRYEIDVHVEVPFDSSVNPADVPLEVEVITELGTQTHLGSADGLSITKVVVPKWNY